MAANTKTNKNWRTYLVVVAFFVVYVASLVVAAIKFHIGIVWLFYGLIPIILSIYLALRAYNENHYRDLHPDRFVHQIAEDRSDDKSYVSVIAF